MSFIIPAFSLLHHLPEDIIITMVEPRSDTNGEKERPIPGLFDIANNYLLLFYAVPCYLMYATLTSLMLITKNLYYFLPTSGLVGIVGPLYLLSLRSPKGFRKDFKLYRPAPKVACLSLIASASVIIPIEALAVVFQKGLVDNSDYINFLLTIKPKGATTYVITGLYLVVVAPLSEELLFRGYVQGIFQRNMRPVIAVFLASLIFGIAHVNPLVIPAAAATGLFFGYIFLRTGNLVLPIVGHALFNAFSFVMLSLSSEEELLSKNVQFPDAKLLALSTVVLIVSIVLIELSHRKNKEGEKNSLPPL